MDTIINIPFKKHPMSFELIHSCPIHPYGSVMEEIWCHRNLTGIQKHFPKKINESPYTVCFTEKMTILTRGTTVDTTKFQQVELIHMDF